MELTQLYLDTARLGRMTASAHRAHLDFARLAAEEGGSLFFERLLRHGTDDWSAEARSRYPGLLSWHGVRPLKESLRSLVGTAADLPVFLANRSAQMMKLAARLLFHACRNVLATDLSWPAYQAVLEAEARRAGCTITTVPLLSDLLEGRLDESEVIELIRAEFVRLGCDGLFLTGVSHLGLCLPVERIVRAAEGAGQVRLVVIDGAQDFCHATSDLRNEYCDLYLAGCHKWLRAYHPLGVAFCGRRRSVGRIEALLAQLLTTEALDDPLLRFSAQLEGDALDGRMETVNLASLFTCQGAVVDALTVTTRPAERLSRRLDNLSTIAGVAPTSGWRPVLPAPPFRTGILLLQADRDKIRQESGEDVRLAFSDCGVAVTAYADGLVRLSMPETDWQPGEVEHLQSALRAVG